MLIGSRIKEARLRKNYSQKKLGDLIGVSKVSISGYESGMRKPQLDQLEGLIKELGVTPNYILGSEVNVIEDNSDYFIRLSKDDIRIINELKLHPVLYNKIIEDPERTIELISRRVK